MPDKKNKYAKASLFKTIKARLIGIRKNSKKVSELVEELEYYEE